MDFLFFGKIALKKGLLSPKQLAEVLKIQENLQQMGYREEVGEICLKLGYLKTDQVEQILEFQKTRAKTHNQLYGKIALENRLLEEKQIQECLEMQKKDNFRAPIGHYILQKNYLSHPDHHSILKRVERLEKDPEADGEPSDKEEGEKQNRKYGKSALLNGFITSDQLDEFFRLKRTQADFSFAQLSDYLIHKKYISLSAHYQILHIMEKSRRSAFPIQPSIKNSDTEALPYLPATKEVYLPILQKKFASPKNKKPSRNRGTEINTHPRLIHLFPDYTLESKLGRGGMAIVFRGTCKKNNQPVAIKVMASPSLTMKLKSSYEEKKDKLIARFVQEAGILTSLKHPNIVQILDAGSQEEYLYYVMEYVRGKTLIEVLEDSPANYLDENWAMEITRDVAKALSSAWKHSIIHRDIKAENILISQDGQVKLFDFGIAKVLQPTFGKRKLTSQHVILGTPVYISPEQARMRGDTPLDFRSDMYSLGVTLYLMLVGEPPYYASSPLSLILMHCNSPIPSAKSHQPPVSQETSDLVTKMLAKLPEDRFDSYESLIESIEKILAKG